MTQRSEVAPNFSSRIVDLRARVVGVGAGLIDGDNQIHTEWASPTTICQQIDLLIKQTDDSMHGFHVPADLAEKLAKTMDDLRRAKNTVSAIQVFGIFADVSQSDRFFAANTVAWLLTEQGDQENLASIRTKLAAELGHRQSKRMLMTSHRVNLGG